MQSVGTRLREARIKKGYTLEEINARTRISLKNLNAIESDDLSKISSPFTYRSFVKQIADMVGVDHETLAADAQSASSAMPEPLVPGQEEEVYVRPHQFQPTKPKSGWNWVRIASVAAALGVISIYLIWRNGGLEAAKLPASPLPAASRAVANSAAENSADQQQRQQSDEQAAVAQQQPPPQMVSAPIPGTTVHAKPVASQPAPAAPQPAVVPGTEQLMSPSQISSRSGEPSPTQIAASPAEPDAATIHLELSAIEPTWLSISADGKTTYSGTLAAMQTKSFDSKDSAQIRTANAGGVNVIFNGRALGPLGAHGQARTVVFTKTGYEVVRGIGSTAMSRVTPTGGE